MSTRKYSLYLLTGLLITVLAISVGAAAPAAPAAKPATATPAGPTPTSPPPNSISIYGTWHCGNDACIWGTIRDMTNFDQMNHWIIDRGDGSGKPSVNLVVLSFIEPLKLLNQTTDATTLNGVPRGMTPAIVSYFTSHGIRVMISIGGITYVKPWDTALATNPTQLGLNAAAVAQSLGVGIEIDWENATKSPNLAGLQAFIDAYRSVLPYDATGNNPAARLTIDVAEGDQWLVDINRKATTDWLKTSNVGTPVLDYANAMVPSRQPSSAADAEAGWYQHIAGYPGLTTPPLAPAKLAGSLFLVPNTGTQIYPECVNFAASLQNAAGGWVQTVAPAGAGTTAGMLGFMFWAAECQGSGTCTTPPNTCEGGMGVAAKTFNIPLPMPPLRQQ
jgi:hypothetical protein